MTLQEAIEEVRGIYSRMPWFGPIDIGEICNSENSAMKREATAIATIVNAVVKGEMKHECFVSS